MSLQLPSVRVCPSSGIQLTERRTGIQRSVWMLSPEVCDPLLHCIKHIAPACTHPQPADGWKCYQFAGFWLRNYTVPGKLLDVNSGPVALQHVEIRSAQFLWPTRATPLTLRVSGVTVKTIQRRTAPPVGFSKRASNVCSRHVGH